MVEVEDGWIDGHEKGTNGDNEFRANYEVLKAIS